MTHTTIVSGVECFRWRPEERNDAPVLNFGDELGPMLVRAMLERAGVRPDRERLLGRRMLSVGSILHFAERGDVVWGSGVNGKSGIFAPSTALDVRAVRGPLSRAVLLSRGIPTPEVYGDPALLVPRLLPQFGGIERGEETIVVPNLNELESFEQSEDATLVSPLGDPEQVIRRIAGAGFVIATSLHALVLADAFGIPSRPLVPGAEDPFKYIDYYAGTGRAEIEFARSVEHARELGPVDAPRLDLDALEAAFPWELWGVPVPDALAPHRVAHGLPNGYAALRALAQRQRDAFLPGLGQRVESERARAMIRLDQFIASDAPRDGITREEAQQLGLELPHLQHRETKPGVQISVVIPTHDVAPWVGETLESVLAQDVEGMEVIVVDDHSIDATPEIVAGYAENDPRVTLVEAISRGGGTARNIGIDHARGEYLVFCDGDDIIPDGAYAALLKSLRASGSDIAFGDYIKFAPTSTWRPTWNMSAYAYPKRGTSLRRDPSLLQGRPCWNKLFDRGWWEARALRFPDAPRSNDIVPMVRAYLLARKVDVIPEVVYLYRDRPGSGSMTANSASNLSMLSYLRQERECAQLVAAADDPDVNTVFSRLVYFYDTYVQVKKYIEGWSEPGAGDAEIASALSLLLADAPPRSVEWGDPFRSAAVTLAAHGEFWAVQAVVAEAENVRPRDAGATLSVWSRVLDRLEEYDLLNAETGERAARTVAGLLAQPVGPEAAEAWAELVESARRRLDGRGVGLIAEVGDAEDSRDVRRTERVLSARARARASLVALERDAGVLKLHGVSDLGEGELMPVLSAGTRAGGAPVRAGRVSWERLPDGRWRWCAEFAVNALPLHEVRVPGVALGVENLVVTIPSDVDLPEYDAKDPLLYERSPGIVLVKRRIHWVPRAARRGAILAVERARRALVRR